MTTPEDEFASPRDAAVSDLLVALEQIAGYRRMQNPSGMWVTTPADVARAALFQWKKFTGGDTRGEANP
jgi:hypothetical protein